jgi:hypothetical protein
LLLFVQHCHSDENSTTIWQSNGGKGKSKRAKRSNLTCFVVFLRLFVAVTPLKMTILVLLLLNMTIFFGQDLATTVYIISMNTPWYHCGTLIN